VELKSKLQSVFQAVGTFFGEVVQEMKKASWPGRQELFESTVVVIVSLFLLSLFVGLCDEVIVKVLKFILPAG
jgi:preprotein translocase subunit SecE